MTPVLLPSLGEGIEAGVVVSVLISVGEHIEENQSILEIETDKVTMEVPSNIAGKVLKIYAVEGEEMNVGATMIEMEIFAATESNAIVLEEDLLAIDTSKKEAPKAIEKVVSAQGDEHEVRWIAERTISQEHHSQRSTPRARKLARQLNIETTDIRSQSGVIVKQDVITHVHNQSHASPAISPGVDVPDFSKLGPIRIEKMSGIMKATAANMAKSWRDIPHAWLTENADITALESERKAINIEHDLRISTTIFIVKAMTKALEKFPIFNASIDMQSQTIIYKEYVNIGIAVDSPNGLYVPVLRDADKKSLSHLSTDLKELSAKAMTRKLTLPDLEGANFTISNLGSIGTNSIFPLVMPNQVAILGVARYQLIAHKKQLPLTIAFDHRIINGADAARFLKFVASLLENPSKILV